MIKISKLADYGTLIMNCLGKQPGTRYSAATIAKMTQIALPTVSKILKLLHEAGLLTSKRGANGGYALMTTADRISIAAIITAIDGKPALTECSLAENLCQQNQHCELSGNWQFINQIIFDLLESVTLADMSRSLVKPVPITFYRSQFSGHVSESIS